jgi:hypothetical protein
LHHQAAFSYLVATKQTSEMVPTCVISQRIFLNSGTKEQIRLDLLHHLTQIVSFPVEITNLVSTCACTKTNSLPSLAHENEIQVRSRAQAGSFLLNGERRRGSSFGECLGRRSFRRQEASDVPQVVDRPQID